MKQTRQNTSATELLIQREKHKHMHSELNHLKYINIEVKQYNEKLAKDLEGRKEDVKRLESQNNILQVRKENLEQKLKIRKSLALISGLINVLATILISFGINMLTTNSSNYSGLAFIAVGVLLICIALVMPFFISI